MATFGSDPLAYEVFVQIGVGKAIQHVGSVRGADPDLAWHAAKEIYVRRDTCTLLWVVPRTAILMSDSTDLVSLGTGGRLDYRQPTYPGKHRNARTAAGAPRP
ncbi:1,2-phenylacetyl-CoA epoxidase subunit B [Pseudonocardia nigra]|uniref:1,2-phenylacetyl-CoA epoxidase subunit B n=1 Tax=Pseudonocardia nigra TaxID=1921578 RepID=UPI001C5E755C